MANEDGNEDRLTKTEFAELIQHLSVQEIVAIEYRVGKSWSKLFTRKNIASNIIICNLCSVEASSFKNLLAHIDGRKHKLQMDRVQQLYHSQYTYPKFDKNDSQSATKSNSSKNDVTLSNNANAKTNKTIPVIISRKPVATAAKSGSNPTNTSTTIKTVDVKNCAKTPSTNSEKETNKNIVKSTPIDNKPSMDVSKSTNKSTNEKKSLNTTTSGSLKTVLTSIEKGKSNEKSIIISDDKSKKMSSTAINNVDTKNSLQTEPKTFEKTKISYNESESTVTAKNTNTNQEKNLTRNTPTTTEESENQNQTTQSKQNNGDDDTSKDKQPMEESASTTTVGGGNKQESVRVTTNKQIQVSGQPKVTAIGKSTNDDKLNLDKSQDSVVKETSVSSSLVKNPFFLKTKPKDGDKQAHEASNDSENTEVSLNIESSTKKAQKATCNVTEGKRPLASDGSDSKAKSCGATEAKKPKIVINPASLLSEKGNSNNNKDKFTTRTQQSVEKPQYQKDIIIIPTKHKSSTSGKEKEVSPRATANKNLPKFSVKTYSSKPSENDVQGVLGVEYVIKILKSKTDTSPRYECGLCELVLDGYAMQRHLEGYNHRLKFCEKHFPTAVRHYRQYMHSLPEHEMFKVMTPVLAKLAIAIEQHHGRNLPYECYERDFSLNRHEILAKAFSCRHASEQYGPTFTHVVGAKEVDGYIMERHKYVAPNTSRSAIFDSKAGNNSSRSDSRNSGKDTITRDRHRHAGRGEGTSGMSTLRQGEMPYKSYMSSSGYSDVYPPLNAYPQLQPVVSQPVVKTVDDETHKLMVEDFLKGTLKGISGGRSRDNRKRSASPTHTSSSAKRKSLSPLRQNDIWQAYRHMVDQELNNLEERFKEYRKDPETHPSYNEEWQKFWKRRKDELIAAGLDHRKYNYQPEWVRFIKIRVEELYGQEVENLKIRSRGRLCLPMTNDYLSDGKYHVQSTSMNAPDMNVNVTSNTGINATALSNAVSTMTSNTTVSSSSTDTPQVVSVLRLMTALEENLGSLGPKIIDLLSKALQAEKTHPTQVNAIILNEENCSLVETAKEKLKGLVMAGLFEGSKNRLLKKVVKETELLLNYAQQLQKISVQSAMQSLETNMSLASSGTISAVANVLNQFKNQSAVGNKPSSSSSLGTLLTQMDKKELASKLAASLVAQGKTDFDPQQLQQLIAVYTLIEKKKRTATALSNKGIAAMSASASSNKKNLSDMLSELLQPTSSNSKSNTQAIDNSASKSKNKNSNTAAESTYQMTNQGAAVGLTSSSNQFYQRNFSNDVVHGDLYPANASFTSASQNTGGNYFSNTTQSTNNATGVSGGAVGGQPDYGSIYTNSAFPPFQQNSNPNQYNNNYQQQYQNNPNMAQNWTWNPNMGMQQSFNMGGGPSDANQSTSNWRNF